ncbi:MAG: response regulator [Bryobacterales bacterium]|nr:response regulator [Bryobacterales bacterium]
MPQFTHQPRILVVDDEEPFRRLLCECLDGREFQVAAAPDGPTALKAIAEDPFDLVICDVNMPGMSGLDLLVEIGKGFPDAGAIMLTGCDDAGMAVTAMRAGALDYIIKPAQPAEILDRVRHALARRNRTREKALHLFLLEETVSQRTVDLTRTLSSLNDASQATLGALVAALDARERETHAHSHRVSDYTVHLAELLGIEDEDLAVVQRGAMLHDIGKIGISDSILLKPGELTEEEWAEMKRHPRIGAWILEGVASLRPASSIVLAHHERFDGGGYPRNLAGGKIPPGARIFAVADSFDAMTSDRPYRKGANYNQARAEIVRNSGSQFDPAVVECFLSVDPAVWDGIRDRAGLAKPRLTAELSDLL